jgi:hypothetical protein
MAVCPEHTRIGLRAWPGGEAGEDTSRAGKTLNRAEIVPKIALRGVLAAIPV